MSVEQTPEEVAAAAQAATDASNAEWQGKIDTLMADNERLSAKISESNKHTKAAETKATKQEKDRLLADENWKQLYESSQIKVAEQETYITDIGLKEISSKEKTAQDQFGSRFTNHSSCAKFLSRDSSDRIKSIDGTIRVLDLNGNLSVATLDDLEMEYRKNPAYDRLIDGVDSSGGSATGSNNSGSAGNVYTRAQFEALNPAERMRVSLESRAGKAKIVDER